jgi:hypothetical protein
VQDCRYDSAVFIKGASLQLNALPQPAINGGASSLACGGVATFTASSTDADNATDPDNPPLCAPCAAHARRASAVFRVQRVADMRATWCHEGFGLGMKRTSNHEARGGAAVRTPAWQTRCKAFWVVLLCTWPQVAGLYGSE